MRLMPQDYPQYNSCNGTAMKGNGCLVDKVSGYLYEMVTQNMCARMKEKKSFRREKIIFVTALDLIMCLKQIKYERWLLTCVPISELRSHSQSYYPSHSQHVFYKIQVVVHASK